jgi:alcohol dehydrogenase
MSREFYEFFCPVKIVAGYKALEHMPFELAARGVARPLLVSDRGVVGAGLVGTVTDALAADGVAAGGVFDDVPPDSSLAAVTAGVAAYREAACDCLIAIGGGSVMDTAKAINILATEGGDDLRPFAGINNLTRPLKPFMAVPTTAGTGSEVTSVTIIKDEAAHSKLPVLSQFLLPDVAVLDPRMTLKLPPAITAATALDALTHATEAFTCLAKNPVSDAYAATAIRAVSRWLVPVLEQPDDAEGRLQLAQAATMAGIAFSNSMVGLVHALGHAVGATSGVHHGTCMGIFLPEVLTYNLEVRRDEIGELLLPLAGADVFARTPAADRAEAAIARIRELKDRVHALCGLPRTLSETGQVRREDLDQIAALALDDGSLIMNPAEVDLAAARRLLEEAW